MSKLSFLLSLLVLFLSCSNDNTKTESRIIYELDQQYSNFIIDFFEKRFNKESGYSDKYNFEKQYVQIGDIKSEIGDLRVAFYTDRDVRCNQQFVSKTNRFLKLKDEYILPIVFVEDGLFVNNNERCLVSVIGGGKIFYINRNDKTITRVSEM